MQNDLLIFFNEKEFNSNINSLNSTIQYINDTIHLYDVLKLEQLKKNEFLQLLFDTDNFLFQKIMKDKPAEFAGMKIDKRNFYDQFIVKPQGYYELINGIELFIRRTSFTAKDWHNNLDVKTYLLKYFTPLDNGKFELKDGIIEEERKSNEVYIKSDKAKQAYKFAVELQNLLNEDNLVNKIGISANKDFGDFIVGIFKSFEPGKEIEINTEFIQKLDTKFF
jgi:hypothetical protein